MKQINPKAIIRDDFEEAIEETLLALKASPFIKEKVQALAIKESELREHLATFVKMDADHHDVEQCRLAGKCLKPQGHYLLDIHRNAIGLIERTMTPCPMLADRLKVNRFMIYDDGDPTWREPKLFDELKMREGRKPLYGLLMKYLTKQSTESLYLVGPHQSGKSFSLSVFANKYALNELGTIGFLDFGLQMNRLLGLKKNDPSTFARELEKIQKLKVCILDGVNSLQITEEMLIDILIPLFIARQKRELITIVTSTVPLNVLDGFFKGYKDKKILMTEWISLIQTICRTTIVLPAMMAL
jgi:hypothetical protein